MTGTKFNFWIALVGEEHKMAELSPDKQFLCSKRTNQDYIRHGSWIVKASFDFSTNDIVLDKSQSMLIIKQKVIAVNEYEQGSLLVTC